MKNRRELWIQNKQKREQGDFNSGFAFKRLQKASALATRAVGEVPSFSNLRLRKPNWITAW